jgi:hypothetical protein
MSTEGQHRQSSKSKAVGGQKTRKTGKMELTLNIIVIERFGCVVKLLEVSLDRIGAESTPAVELFRHILWFYLIFE